MAPKFLADFDCSHDSTGVGPKSRRQAYTVNRGVFSTTWIMEARKQGKTGGKNNGGKRKTNRQ